MNNMNAKQVPASIWQQMIQQNFLSLYDLSKDKITDPEYFQGYDFVFEFSNATVYLIVNDVVMQASKQGIDSTQVRAWRKEVVNQLIKQHAQLYLKNDKAIVNKNEATFHKPIYFIGLTSLSVQHQDSDQNDKYSETPSYAVGYEYGSQFFAEDCVGLGRRTKCSASI